jgi:hypothetical protein
MLYYAGTVQWCVGCLLEADFDDHVAITIVDEKPTVFVFGSDDAVLGRIAERGGNLAANQDKGYQGKRLAFPQKAHGIQAAAPPIRQIDFSATYDEMQLGHMANFSGAIQVQRSQPQHWVHIGTSSTPPT